MLGGRAFILCRASEIVFGKIIALLGGSAPAGILDIIAEITPRGALLQ